MQSVRSGNLTQRFTLNCEPKVQKWMQNCDQGNTDHWARSMVQNGIKTHRIICWNFKRRSTKWLGSQLSVRDNYTMRLRVTDLNVFECCCSAPVFIQTGKRLGHWWKSETWWRRQSNLQTWPNHSHLFMRSISNSPVGFCWAFKLLLTML